VVITGNAHAAKYRTPRTVASSAVACEKCTEARWIGDGRSGECIHTAPMTNTALIEEALSKSVIGAFYEVYNTLGYGYYEHFYTKALDIELGLRGHKVAREVSFPVVYKTYYLGLQRVDMVVDDKLMVETKSTQELHRGAPRQLFSYLHGSRFEIGLLLHFGPDAKFYPVVCRNSDSRTAGENLHEAGQAPNPAGTRGSRQGSDSSILEFFNSSRLLVLAAKILCWWSWRKQRRLEAKFLQF
jgi:GxxExxY protein